MFSVKGFVMLKCTFGIEVGLGFFPLEGFFVLFDPVVSVSLISVLL